MRKSGQYPRRAIQLPRRSYAPDHGNGDADEACKMEPASPGLPSTGKNPERDSSSDMEEAENRFGLEHRSSEWAVFNPMKLEPTRDEEEGSSCNGGGIPVAIGTKKEEGPHPGGEAKNHAPGDLETGDGTRVELQRIARKVANHPYFGGGIILCIMVNTITMAIESDTARPSAKTALAFSIFQWLFFAIFNVEMAIKIFALGLRGYVGEQAGLRSASFAAQKRNKALVFQNATVHYATLIDSRVRLHLRPRPRLA